ncbi:MAG TPA: SAM-dependent methyltransferase [Trebonia sp.]|nr:SAM-dependent methyltransferase [Trebonia sp.]
MTVEDAGQSMSWARADHRHFPPEIDVTQPSVARVYDAILGGKDNFEADRAVAEMAHRAFPDGGRAAHINREMLGRAVRYMAGQGVRQFLDLGSGLPTAQNTHQIAQGVDPGARVVYVDNDPMVLAHGRALLADNASTIVVTADLREPDAIWSMPEITGFLDLSQPVGLILNAVVHHVLDEEDPYRVVARYVALLAPGSYLLLTHFSSSSPEARALEGVLLRTLGRGQLRTRDEISRFFDGLEVVEPGVGYLPDWHPDGQVPAVPGISELLYVGGLGRKA